MHPEVGDVVVDQRLLKLGGVREEIQNHLSKLCKVNDEGSGSLMNWKKVSWIQKVGARGGRSPAQT